MINLARVQLVNGERGRIEEPVYLTPKALPEAARRHELLSMGPLAVWASVPPFVQIRAPGSLGAAGCTQVKLEGQRGGASPSERPQGASSPGFSAAAPPPRPL